MGVKTGILLITFLAGSFALPAQETESEFFFHTDPSARIVGGSIAAENSVPHMVALTNGALIRSFLCGGSLITQRTVLTAAHCIDAVYRFGSLSNSLRVTVGTNRWNSGGQTYNVDRNVTHQHYVPRLIKNDIGILITSSDVALGNAVQTIPISYDFVNTTVLSRVAGWGRTRRGGSLSTQLLELSMATTDVYDCRWETTAVAAAHNMVAPAVDPDIELCAQHSRGHGMCNGDSGSALVRVDRQQQIGIVSWGIPCALGAPDVFVRVSAYSAWLHQHTV